MRKVFLLIILCILVLPFAKADYFEFTPDKSFADWTFGGNSNRFSGQGILTPNYPVRLLNVSVGGDGSISKVYLYKNTTFGNETGSYTINIANATLTGGGLQNATFNVQLEKNTVYWIVVGNDGGAFNFMQNLSTKNYPISFEHNPSIKWQGAVEIEYSTSAIFATFNTWKAIVAVQLNETIPVFASLNSPSNSSLLTAGSQIFNYTFTPGSGFNLTNGTLSIYGSSGLFNRTTNILSGSQANISLFNISNFSPGKYIFYATGCAINLSGSSSCTTEGINYTIYGGISDIFFGTIRNPAYETESFTFNITFNVTSGTPSARFWWNGTGYTATVINIIGNMWLGNATIDIPSRIGVRDYFWELTAGSLIYNTSVNYQNVTAINLSICNGAPFNFPYVNFTFKNETPAAQTVSASIISTWIYYLGSGTSNKSYSLTNTTENPSYAFCFTPQNRTLQALPTIQYYNSESPTRTYQPTPLTLTSLTSNIILYLLPSSQGIYTYYRTITSTGAIVPGVSVIVTKEIAGVPTIVASGTTDDSGMISFFLDPNVLHTFVFSKSGFSDTTFQIFPNSPQVYDVLMGGGVGGSIGNGTQFSYGTLYTILPENSTLLNDTSYTFSLTVNSNQTVSSVSQNITNASGFQLSYQTGSGVGTISDVINTNGYSKIIGYYEISDGTETIRVTRTWIVGNFYIGDYSLYRQLTLFHNYGFTDFLRILIALATITTIMIFLSRGEVLDTSESKIAALMILVWIFSYVGWLDTGLFVGSGQGSLTTLGELSSQYGLAIVTTLGSVFFLFRRLFI